MTMIIPILFLPQRTLLPTCCELPHGYFTGGQGGFLTRGIEFGWPTAAHRLQAPLTLSIPGVYFWKVFRRCLYRIRDLKTWKKKLINMF